MRPIFKGAIPVVNGTAKTVNDYKEWRSDLIGRLGPFCCFCNIPLKDSIQVEHVIAQDIDNSRRLDWDNMLLACGPCNRSKSNKPCPPSTHYLPQFHNTHLTFTHTFPAVLLPRHADSPAVFLSVRPGNADSAKARNTIDLCSLDKDTTRKADQVTDLRWKFRHEALLAAFFGEQSGMILAIPEKVISSHC